MNERSVENTLFIGNGFSRTIFRDMPSWDELFTGVSSSIQNYTILYEVFLLGEKRNGRSEESVKEELVKNIEATFSGKNVKDDIQNLEQFGAYLVKYQVNNIITTNYDNGIEFILCEYCGYREQTPKDMVAETVYSIRTYRLLVNDDSGHQVKLWKIHGDLKRIRSITLGFDQYCGSLSKLSEYIKGTYKSSKKGAKVVCAGPMDLKCKNQTFDGLSWAELFFRTNVTFVGFGLDSSEIDIWWLLNKRARMMMDLPQIRNTITYLYNEDFEVPVKTPEHKTAKEKKALFDALDALQITYCPIRSDLGYLDSIFETMKES